jgi:hypothetical protein
MISCLRTENKDFIPEQLLSFCGCPIGQAKQKVITLFNPGHVSVDFNIAISNDKDEQQQELGEIFKAEPNAGQLKPGH